MLKNEKKYKCYCFKKKNWWGMGPPAPPLATALIIDSGLKIKSLKKMFTSFAHKKGKKSPKLRNEFPSTVVK